MNEYPIKNKRITEYVVLILMGAVFYFLFSGLWIKIDKDSAFYMGLKDNSLIMPIYPTFLRMIKIIIGEKYYLDGVVVVQSLLAIFCTMLFVVMLRERFGLKLPEEFLLYGMCMLPYSYDLPESGVTHQILTEGLTYSLFYIYFIALLLFVLDRQYKWGIALILMTLVMMFVRSQLIVLVLTTFSTFVYVLIRKNSNRIKIVKVAAGFCGLILVCGGLFIAALRTQVIDLPQFTDVLIIRGFYEVDYEDKELFDTPEMQEIFDRVYYAVDEAQNRYVYARHDLYMWKDLLGDRISQIAGREINQYALEHPDLNINNRKIIQELGATILFRHFGRYLYHTGRMMISSFIAAVFWQIEPIYLLCHFITLLLYLYAIIGSIICLRQKGNSQAAEFMLTVTSFIFILVLVVNIMYFGMQRYVIYAMGIFYCAAYLLLRDLIMLYTARAKQRLAEDRHFGDQED